MPGKDVAPCQDFSSQFISRNSVHVSNVHILLYLQTLVFQPATALVSLMKYSELVQQHLEHQDKVICGSHNTEVRWTSGLTQGQEQKKLLYYAIIILMLSVTFSEVNDKSRISLTRLYNLTQQPLMKRKNIGFCHNSIKYTQFE